jgi:hypothetical protein
MDVEEILKKVRTYNVCMLLAHIPLSLLSFFSLVILTTPASLSSREFGSTLATNEQMMFWYTLFYGVVFIITTAMAFLYLYLAIHIRGKNRTIYILQFVGFLWGIVTFVAIIPSVILVLRWETIKYFKSDGII